MRSAALIFQKIKEMDNFSILIAGKAGFGIDRSGSIIGRLLAGAGRHIYIYRDYPSIIRGGHTFSIIRASLEKRLACLNKIDFLLALDQEAFDLHKERIKDTTVIIYDSDIVEISGFDGNKKIAIPISSVVKEENAPEIMRNSSIVAAFCHVIGLPWENLEKVLHKEFSSALEINLKVARRGWDASQELQKIGILNPNTSPLITGNEAIALGLANGGLQEYIAYPMTPSSPVLHFLAQHAQKLSINVTHPESEIAVVLMGLGFAYSGKRAAVGTSGGGFCLMTEGLSFAGMAELPLVFVLGQRPGPSTGLPTYSAQTELFFALYAGQGEFARLVVAPGDLEESYFWSTVAMNMSWKYQIPSIILTDKNLGEGVLNFDINSVDTINREELSVYKGTRPYKRYAFSDTGISPLAFAPYPGITIKVNSYEHDEYGITTEDPGITMLMQEKRLRKENHLREELKDYQQVNIYGNQESPIALLCWGSNKGVCLEVAERLKLKVIQPVVLWPFPQEEFAKDALGAKRIICVENNATAQLAQLVNMHGVKVDEKILKYDGRAFFVDELEERIKKII